MNSNMKFAALVVAMLSGLGVRAANVWYVDDDAAAGGNGSEAAPYRTIQDAINASTTLAGDTILVKPGTYTEGGKSYGSSYTQRNRVYITKNELVIKSTGGKEITHIVGGTDDTACIMADATGLVIEGFTLRDGLAVNGSGAAGGISSGKSGTGAEQYALVDCVISNCTGRTGAMKDGIAIRCRITGNKPTYYGSVTGSSLYNCIVERQTGGPNVLKDCFVVVNTTVVNNRVDTKTCFNDKNPTYYYNSVIFGNGKPFEDSNGIYSNCVADGASGTPGLTTIASDQPFVNLYMSAVTEDFRPVKDGLLDGTGDKALWPAEVPEAYRGFDFGGRPLKSDADIPIGVIIDSAEPADVGVAVVISLRLKFNGHPAVTGYHVHHSDSYPTSVYVEPTDEITNSLAAISINSYGSMTTPLHHWLGVKKGVWITPPPAGAKSKTGADLGPVPVYGQSVSKHFYVDCNLDDYTDHNGSEWRLAFKTIQEAVSAAAGSASWIHVRAGDYNEGGDIDTSIVDGYGRVVANTGANATLISSEGDVANTIIRGAYGAGNYSSGDGAARCLILNGSKLGVTGFTLAGGACSNTSNTYGGGIYAANNNVVVSDCIIDGCRGYNCSSAYQGTLMRCEIRNGMSRVCATRNGYTIACVYRSNYSNPTSCHGPYTSQVCVNCTVYDPNATDAAQVNNENTDFVNCAFAAGGYLLTVKDVAFDGNVAQNGGLKKVDDSFASILPFGELHLTDPSAGDFRPFVESACVGAGTLASTVRPYEWTSRYIGFDIDNNPVVTEDGEVVAGAVATLRQPMTYYADANRTDPSGDGRSEATAKKTLAEAMGLPLLYGDEVVALPGTYASQSQIHTVKSIGTSAITIRSRVVVPSGITLRSRDGAERTIIAGQSATVGADEYGRGADAMRGAYVAAGGCLRGFTITGGRTAAGDDTYKDDQTGGGVLGGSSTTALVEDCILTDNVSSCGGGASFASCARCKFLNNVAPRYGSAVRCGSLYNCFFKGNRGPRTTEVLYDCVNCTYCDNYGLDGVKATQTFQNMGDCANLANVLVCGVVMTIDNSTGNAVNAKKVRNCIFPKEMGVVPTASWPADTEDVNMENSLAELREMFVDGYPVSKDVLTVDAGFALTEAGDTDVLGAARVQNVTLDIGAFEYSWLGDYGKALGRRVEVTETEKVVETDGEVMMSDGGKLAATWTMSADGSAPDCPCTVSATLDGTGTLYVYLNGAEEPIGTLTESGTVRFDNTQAVNDLVVKYVGEGSATLGLFRRELGLSVIVR